MQFYRSEMKLVESYILQHAQTTNKKNGCSRNLKKYAHAKLSMKSTYSTVEPAMSSHHCGFLRQVAGYKKFICIGNVILGIGQVVSDL